MEDLIKALMIFSKYSKEHYPTHCSHETLGVNVVDVKDVSEQDLKELEELSFVWDEDEGYFCSFRFGSN